MNLRPAAKWLVLTVLVGLSMTAGVLLTWHSLRIRHLFVQTPSVATGVVAFDPPPEAGPVTYRFEAGGRPWTGSFQADRVRTNYRAGDALPIYYLAPDPSVNSVRKPAPDDLALLTAQYVILDGMVACAVGLVAYRWLTKSKREPFSLDTREFPGWWAW